jgi:serine/threonine protein kinase
MDESLPEGAVVAGRLRVVRTLGVGGMGAVYEVEHLITKHRRALKLLHADVARMPGVVERFLREASAAGRVGNPHVVETFDAGTTEHGEPYIVMELLKGRSLADRLVERGVLELAEVVELLDQASEGVQAAHDAGIVHRDLKPENLFVVEGERPFVKIVDFGISKFDPARTGTSSQTADGSMMGTPYYMPPEQVRGAKDAGAAADVYALGIVAYECLTGRRPFEATTLPELVILIYEGKYARPTELRPELPAEIDGVIARALAKEPSERFSTPRAFGAALRRAGVGAAKTSWDPSSIPPAASRAAASIGLGTAPALSHTTPGRATSASPESEKQKKTWVVAGVALALVLVLGALLFRNASSSESPAAEPGESAATPARQSESTAARPEVSPALDSPTPVVAASAEAPASSARSGASATTSASAKIRAPAASASASRARERGLAEENPF